MKHLFLHTKDVMITNEVAEKTARKIISDINSHYQAPKRSFVSLKVYCEYFMVDKSDVIQCLEAYRKKAS